MRDAAALFVPGVIFGAGLGISGMTNPAKVIGFLDLFGSWDPSLAFVMIGAVGSFGALAALLRGRRPVQGGEMPGPSTTPIDAKLLAGAAVFGIGWGLSGFCPGPALTNLGALRVEALAFVPAMAVGMVVAQHFFGADR